MPILMRGAEAIAPCRLPYGSVAGDAWRWGGSIDGKAARRRPCCEHAGSSALRKLVASSRLVQADLLALDLACIARDQPSLLEHGLQRGIVLDQRAGDAVTHCPGLARFTAAVHVD